MNAAMNPPPGNRIPTRASLLSRMKNWDDRDSWQDFYDTYWRLIHGVALKAGLTEDEANEALQETVIAVAEEIRKFKYDPEKGSFKAWLLQQTRWRIVGQFRKRNRHQRKIAGEQGRTALMEEVADPATEEVSESLWDEEWQQNLFAVALERVKTQVDPRTFQIFQLRVLQDRPAAEVSKILGVSRALVYVAKNRVSNRIKKEMQRLARLAMKPAVEALGSKK